MISWIEKNYDHLASTYALGKLPHALLISAPHGAGKSELARQLNQLILCASPNIDSEIYTACGYCKQCLLLKGGTHPDLLTIENDRKSIGVDEIRKVSSFLQKTPQIAQKQVVIVLGIEYLTESAANAFLKTLEEPTANSFIILTTSDQSKLLPTIVSRCHIEKIALPKAEQLGEYSNTAFNIDRFTNFHQLPEISDGVIFEKFRSFIDSISNWFVGSENSFNTEKALLNEEYTLRWLEWYITNLMRKKAGADICFPLKESLAQEIETRYTYSKLAAISTKITKTSMILKQIGSANHSFAIQKLVLGITEELE